MLISKITTSGRLTDALEVETDEVPSDMYAAGYRKLTEPATEPVLTQEEREQFLMYFPTYKYDRTTDTNKLEYGLTTNTTELLHTIKTHTAALASTDYIITKHAEATITPAPMTADPDAPNPITDLNLGHYNLPEILAERARLRQQIRRLRTLLADQPETPAAQ